MLIRYFTGGYYRKSLAKSDRFKKMLKGGMAIFGGVSIKGKVQTCHTYTMPRQRLLGVGLCSKYRFGYLFSVVKEFFWVFCCRFINPFVHSSLSPPPPHPLPTLKTSENRKVFCDIFRG